MRRLTILPASLLMSICTAQAQELDVINYFARDSGEVARQPIIQKIIQAGMEPHDAEIANIYLNHGVTMLVEVNKNDQMLLHACIAHECGEDEVRIVITSSGHLYANLMIDHQSKMIGGKAPLPLQASLAIPSHR